MWQGVRRLQLTDGSYASHRGGENDMRFVYCAAVICHLLGDWAGMDIPLAATYIHRSQSYDGGYGLGPRLEVPRSPPPFHLSFILGAFLGRLR